MDRGSILERRFRGGDKDPADIHAVHRCEHADGMIIHHGQVAGEVHVFADNVLKQVALYEECTVLVFPADHSQITGSVIEAQFPVGCLRDPYGISVGIHGQNTVAAQLDIPCDPVFDDHKVVIRPVLADGQIKAFFQRDNKLIILVKEHIVAVIRNIGRDGQGEFVGFVQPQRVPGHVKIKLWIGKGKTPQRHAAAVLDGDHTIEVCRISGKAVCPFVLIRTDSHGIGPGGDCTQIAPQQFIFLFPFGEIQHHIGFRGVHGPFHGHRCRHSHSPAEGGTFCQRQTACPVRHFRIGKCSPGGDSDLLPVLPYFPAQDFA